MTKYKHITLIDHIDLSNINNILNLCIDFKV